MNIHIQMKRLYEAAKNLKGITGQSELARTLNTSPQTVKNWETRGMSKQGMLVAQKVIGCNALWIQTGKGNMQSGKGTDLSISEDYVTFELLDIQAAAGNGYFSSDYPEVIEHVNVLKSWAQTQLGGNLSRIHLITAAGDSMRGTIEDGDVLFVDSTIRHYISEGIYIIYTKDGAKVKRLQRLMNGDLKVISDNKAYDPPDVVREEATESVVICGKVVAAWNIKRFQ